MLGEEFGLRGGGAGWDGERHAKEVHDGVVDCWMSIQLGELAVYADINFVAGGATLIGWAL